MEESESSVQFFDGREEETLKKDAQQAQTQGSSSEEDDGRKVFEEDTEVRRKTAAYSDKPYWDGVFECDPIAANDTVAARELMEGMAEDTQELQVELQALVASVVRVQQLQQGEEERPPPSPLEVLLSTRNEMLLSYVTLLQMYMQLKLCGEWFPEHKVASMLVDVRIMLVDLDRELQKYADEMQAAIHAVAEHAQAVEQSKLLAALNHHPPAPPPPAAISLPPTASAHLLAAPAADARRLLRSKALMQQESEKRVQRGDAQAREGREWLAGDKEREEGSGSKLARLQGLLWKAGAVQEKMKRAGVVPEGADQWLVENKERIAERWTEAFDYGMEEEEEEGPGGSGAGAGAGKGAEEGHGGGAGGGGEGGGGAGGGQDSAPLPAPWLRSRLAMPEGGR